MSRNTDTHAEMSVASLRKVLRQTVCCPDMSMCRQVRMVDDAAERLRKRQRDEARASSAQQRTAASSAAAQVRAQVRLH